MGDGTGKLFNGYRVSIWRDEPISGDWLQNSINVFTTIELYA